MGGASTAVAPWRTEPRSNRCRRNITRYLRDRVMVVTSNRGTTASSSSGDDSKTKPSPTVDPNKTNSNAFGPDNETTALALRPPETALTPLMTRLREKTRTFSYPPLNNLRLTVDQKWNEDKVGTGASVWDAADVLSNTLASTGLMKALQTCQIDSSVATNEHALQWWHGKSVVELGAGLGLSSMVCSALGAKVLATDGDDVVVQACSQVFLDNTEAIEASALHSVMTPPSAGRLLWGDQSDCQSIKRWIENANDASSNYPHVILMSDVIYGENELVWTLLLETLNAIAGPSTFIVLAHTKRGAKKTEKRFITLASEVGFSVINAETFVEQKDGFVAVTVVYALSRSDRS